MFFVAQSQRPHSQGFLSHVVKYLEPFHLDVQTVEVKN